MENAFEHSKPTAVASAIDYTPGGIVSKIVSKNTGGNLTLFAFDAGQALSEHAAPFDAVVQVIEGTGEYIIGGVPHTVKAGQLIIMPANVPHAVRAPEAFKMLLFMIKG